MHFRLKHILHTKVQKLLVEHKFKNFSTVLHTYCSDWNFTRNFLNVLKGKKDLKMNSYWVPHTDELITKIQPDDFNSWKRRSEVWRVTDIIYLNFISANIAIYILCYKHRAHTYRESVRGIAVPGYLIVLGILWVPIFYTYINGNLYNV